MRTTLRIVLVTVIVAAGVRGAVRARHDRKARAARAHDIAFRVPTGQDAADFVSRLRVNDLPARVRLSGGHEDVLVTVTGPPERERARQVIHQTASQWGTEAESLPRPLFEDER
jgi:hypothetical protein